MYAIYGNIYHQYTPMLAYIPYMDPMGYRKNMKFTKFTFRAELGAIVYLALISVTGHGDAHIFLPMAQPQSKYVNIFCEQSRNAEG